MTASGPTPEQDAEDLGLVLREARQTQGLDPAELAQRVGLIATDVLEFEAGGVIPAKPIFAVHMRALGFAS